ncbi:ATP synthase F0 sector subunit C [Sesbania bispinosa]|nr:ATP synthase F0 sector subunit C [Sesbania bispinosa]
MSQRQPSLMLENDICVCSVYQHRRNAQLPPRPAPFTATAPCLHGQPPHPCRKQHRWVLICASQRPALFNLSPLCVFQSI